LILLAYRGGSYIGDIILRSVVYNAVGRLMRAMTLTEVLLIAGIAILAAVWIGR
jgi:hypothetical protein